MKEKTNKKEHAIINGEIIEKEKAVIPIYHKGYFFDFAVYSSIKVLNGKTFFPRYHVERLFHSAKIIGLSHNFKVEEVLSWIEKLREKDQLTNSLLRIVLVGDPDGKEKPLLYIFSVSGLTFYPDKWYRQGVKVITYCGERFLPQAKTTNLLLNFLALETAKKQNALEALLLDREGNIREGTRSNFFAIKGNYIFTPPKEKVLEGITQKILFMATKGIFSIVYQDISLKTIKEYEECFISSTSMNIMPIRQIDEMFLRENFPKVYKIQRLFKEWWKKHLNHEN